MAQVLGSCQHVGGGWVGTEFLVPSTSLPQPGLLWHLEVHQQVAVLRPMRLLCSLKQ